MTVPNNILFLAKHVQPPEPWPLDHDPDSSGREMAFVLDCATHFDNILRRTVWETRQAGASADELTRLRQVLLRFKDEALTGVMDVHERIHPEHSLLPG